MLREYSPAAEPVSCAENFGELTNRACDLPPDSAPTGGVLKIRPLGEP